MVIYKSRAAGDGANKCVMYELGEVMLSRGFLRSDGLCKKVGRVDGMF